MPPSDGQLVAGVTGADSGASAMAMAVNAVNAVNAAVSVPYTCTFCQRSFPRLSLLKKHEQVRLVFWIYLHFGYFFLFISKINYQLVLNYHFHYSNYFCGLNFEMMLNILRK